MTYKIALACNKFEQVFVDQLKRTSELVSILTGNCSTKFSLEIDAQRNKALLWMSHPKVGGKVMFEGPNITVMSDANKIEALRNTMATVSSFLSKFNGSLAEIRKSCLTCYTQEQWDIIYGSSNENTVSITESTISGDELVEYSIYSDGKSIIPSTAYNLFATSCGISEEIATKAFVSKDAMKASSKTSSLENEDEIESAIRNIQKEVTNEETVKGTYNGKRVMIPHPDNLKNVKVRQFDKSKDFTVLDTIKALLKFDLDLPVNIVCFAPAIGCYDMHINKIAESSLYGYDKKASVGLYVDEN